jgi:hypothetical protein
LGTVVGKFVFFSAQATGSKSDASNVGETWIVPNADEAISRTREILGVPESVSQITAKQVTLTNDKTPFLHHEVEGRPLWKVEIRRWRLHLPSAPPRTKDQFSRTFDVLLDPITGNVLSITSQWPRHVPPIAPRPSAASAQDKMRRSGDEVYHAFAPAAPAISFTQALDAILRQGYGDVLVARQFVAHNVIQSRLGATPRPVWAITLRGIPPIRAAFPGVHVDARNHLRHIVDSETGEWICAGTSPQPDLVLAPRIDPPPPDPNDPNCPDPNAPAVVTFDLSSPSNGQQVTAGQAIAWSVNVTVDECAGLGLAMAVLDYTQDPTNPELIDIPPAVRPPSMACFDRPLGISNPDPIDAPDPIDPNTLVDPNTVGSAFGGTPFGAPGAKNLLEIGGAQNNFGVIGNGVGFDTSPDVGVGQQAGGQLLVSGTLLAPAAVGVYTFRIENVQSNVFREIREEPEFSAVREASIVFSSDSISFTVVGASCGAACDVPGGDADVTDDCSVDIADLGIVLANFGLGPTPPQAHADGDTDGDADVDITDLGAVLGLFGISCP